MIKYSGFKTLVPDVQQVLYMKGATDGSNVNATDILWQNKWPLSPTDWIKLRYIKRRRRAVVLREN